MSSYSSQYYSSPAAPIPAGNSKAQQYAAYHSGGYHSGSSNYSASPEDNSYYYDDQAERDASVTSGHPSTHGGYSSGYGDAYTTTTDSTGVDYGYYDVSGGNYHHQGGHDAAAMTQGSASGVDFNEYIQDRFADSFDPIPLDRSLAVQAQTSGALNGKQHELLELQAKAQARLAKSRARFQQGMQDAQEVRADLEWTSKKVHSLKKKAEKKHSKDYKKARERYPSPEY